MPRNKKANANQVPAPAPVPAPAKVWPGVKAVEDRHKAAMADYRELRDKFLKEAQVNPTSAIEWAAPVVNAQETARHWQHALHASKEGRDGLARFADYLLRDLLMHTKTHNCTCAFVNACDEMRHFAVGKAYEAVLDILQSCPAET